MNYNTIVKMAIQDIKTDVLPSIKIKNFKLVNISNKKSYLGFYKHNSCFNIPIIKLNKPIIMKYAKEPNSIGLYDIILTTILHELGHALQELKGKPFNENEAEDFAYFYWDWKEIITI